MTTIIGETSRRQRIDFFRLCAIFMIVLAHIQFFGNLRHGAFLAAITRLVILITVRYTMPLFFVLAGYFVGGKIAQEPSEATSIAYAYTKRLTGVFLFWCVIYALESPRDFLSLMQNQPITLVFQGSRVHLWFLVSLALTVWLLVLWPDRKNILSFLLLGGALYAVGLLAGPYKVTPIGFDIHFNTRNGVFFSTLFFAIGVALRRKTPRVSRRTAIGMTLGGLGMYTLEALYLWIEWGLSPAGHDYLLGTIPFGVGVSLLALTQPDSPLDRSLGPYGRYTLGVYASHMLFIILLRPLGSFVHPFVWQLIFPVFVFSLSMLTIFVLERTPLRSVVM